MGNPLSRPKQPAESSFRPKPSKLVVTDCRATHTHCFPPDPEQPRRFILVGTFAEFERLFDDPSKPDDNLQRLLQHQGGAGNKQATVRWHPRGVEMLVGSVPSAEQGSTAMNEEEADSTSPKETRKRPSKAATRVAAMLHQAVFCESISAPRTDASRETSTKMVDQEKQQHRIHEMSGPQQGTEGSDEMIIVYEDWNIEVPTSQEQFPQPVYSYGDNYSHGRNLGCLLIVDYRIHRHNPPKSFITERYDMLNEPGYRREPRCSSTLPSYTLYPCRWSPKRGKNWTADWLYNEKNCVVLFPWCDMAPKEKERWLRAAQYLVDTVRKSESGVEHSEKSEVGDGEQESIDRQQQMNEEKKWWDMRQAFNAFD